MSFKLKSGRKSAKSALPAARKFTSDRRGNVAIIFGMAMVPALMMVGAGIDYGNAFRAKQQLQAAVDSAVLAAISANGKTDAERKVIGEQTFAANVSQSPLTAGATATVSVSGGAATATTSLAVPTSFMALAQVDSLSVGAAASAASAGKNLEVSMMIDLTGSMGQTRNGQKKIDGLKEAGADLLNILFPGGETTSSTVRVGVVPFADYVNAGDLASTVTGLPSTGGLYSNYENLTKTRQGSFGGSYSGANANGSGSQFGATAPTSSDPNAGSSTFSNDYCSAGANQTSYDVSALMKVQRGNKEYPAAETVSDDGYNGDAPEGLVKASNNQEFIDFNQYHKNQGWKWDNGNESNAYMVPIPTSVSGLEMKTHAGWDDGQMRTGPIGTEADVDDKASSIPAHIKKAKSQTEGGYWRIKKVKSDGTLQLQWKDGSDDYFFPVYTNLNVPKTVECSTAQTEPQGKLITCVTDRKMPNGTVDYTDDAPSASSYIGPYNQNRPQVSNYSEDGKCYTAGRELPAVIPLTNSKDTLSSFFTNATIGGATPGHLGTAWAWYLLSPNWANVLPTDSAPVAYNQATTKKVAILMTDGEYNIHYASPRAVTQAKAYCDGMKAKNIEVYTIGFGFAAGTVANASGTSSERAREVLEYCATGSNHYYFPYDGAALRQAFSSIGQALMAGQKQLRVTN